MSKQASHFERVVKPAMLKMAQGKTGHTGKGTTIKTVPTAKPPKPPTPTPASAPQSTKTIPELLKQLQGQVETLDEKVNPRPQGLYMKPDGDVVAIPLQKPEERQFAPPVSYFEKAKHA